MSPSTSMANRALDTTQHEFSNNTLITGGNFVTVGEGGVFQTHTHFPTIRKSTGKYQAIRFPHNVLNTIGMRTLAKVMAPGAFHNSAERCNPPKCHPKTREAVLKKVMDWVQGLGESEDDIILCGSTAQHVQGNLLLLRLSPSCVMN